MGWHYKSPTNFPAVYFTAVRSAARNLGQPQLFGSFVSLPEATALAERFRWFKWCIRQDPMVSLELYSIISNLNIRTFLETDPYGYTLWLLAKPTKISDFIENNPKLAEEILMEITD